MGKRIFRDRPAHYPIRSRYLSLRGRWGQFSHFEGQSGSAQLIRAMDLGRHLRRLGTEAPPGDYD
jgi:hypothetical protein